MNKAKSNVSWHPSTLKLEKYQIHGEEVCILWTEPYKTLLCTDV